MKKLYLIPFLFIANFCISQTSNKVIGNSKYIEGLEVAEYDFPKVLKWEDAKIACSRLGVGWRLPTKDELNILFKYRERIGNFFITEDNVNYNRNLYYSSSEGGIHHGYIKAWIQDFSNGEQFDGDKLYPYSVRAVRKYKININIK